MDGPESSPAYLAHCTETFFDVLSEARALVVQGRCDERLADTLHFANDLVAIIADSVHVSRYDPIAANAVEYLAGQVSSLRTHARSFTGTH